MTCSVAVSCTCYVALRLLASQGFDVSQASCNFINCPSCLGMGREDPTQQDRKRGCRKIKKLGMNSRCFISPTSSSQAITLLACVGILRKGFCKAIISDLGFQKSDIRSIQSRILWKLLMQLWSCRECRECRGRFISVIGLRCMEQGWQSLAVARIDGE